MRKAVLVLVMLLTLMSTISAATILGLKYDDEMNCEIVEETRPLSDLSKLIKEIDDGSQMIIKSDGATVIVTNKHYSLGITPDEDD